MVNPKAGVKLGEGQSRVLDYSVKVLARNFYRNLLSSVAPA